MPPFRSCRAGSAVSMWLLGALLFSSPAFAQSASDTTLGRLRIDRELLLRLPLRTLTDVNAMLPGAVIHERRSYGYAGLPWEQVWTLDDISLHDPFTGAPAIQLIPEGLSAVTVHRSTFEAGRTAAPTELALELLRGGDEFTFSLHGATDGFADPGTKFLGAVSQGAQQFSVVASGPIVPGLRFAAAASLSATENRQPLYLSWFTAQGLTTDNLGLYPANTPLPGPIAFQENFLPHNGLSAAAAQGRVDWDISSLSLALTFALNGIDAPIDNDWPAALQNVYRLNRALTLEQRSELMALSGRLRLDDATTIEASAAYLGSRQRTVDPDFGEEWQLYVDSASNAQRGHDGWTSTYHPPAPYSTIYQFLIAHENTPNDRYVRSEVSGWQFDLRARRTVTEEISLAAGAHYESWTGRAFSVSNIASLMTYLNGPDGQTPRTFSSEEERRNLMVSNGEMLLIGTNVDGGNVEDGPDAPATPSKSSAFVEAQFEGERSLIAVGVHAVSFQPPVASEDATTLFLPRATARIDLGSGWAWESAAGFHAAVPPLWDILAGRKSLGASFGDRAAYILSSNQTIGSNMGPVRSWLLETAGILRFEFFTLRLGGFYGTWSDRYGVARSYSSTGVPTGTVWLERDPIDLYGLEALVDVRPLSVASLRAWYRWNSTDGLEGHPIGPTPYTPHPATRNHQVRGILTLHSAGVERFGEEGIYAVAVYSGLSGSPYRPIQMPSLGTATAWNIGVRGIADARLRVAASSEDERMPFAHRVDLQAGGVFTLGGVKMEASISVYNLFDRREVLGVYPNTGKTDDDGWLTSPFAVAYDQIPFYTAFYGAINLANRWAYMSATGSDMYGEPRQVQVGVRVWL